MDQVKEFKPDIIIGKEYRDKDGFYVAEVKTFALEGTGTTFKERLTEAISIYGHIVTNGQNNINLDNLLIVDPTTHASLK
jgi:hypothetical protein